MKFLPIALLSVAAVAKAQNNDNNDDDDGFFDTIGNGVKDAFGGLFDDVEDAFSGVGNDVKTKLEDKWDNIGGEASSVWAKATGGVDDAKQELSDWIATATENVAEASSFLNEVDNAWASRTADADDTEEDNDDDNNDDDDAAAIPAVGVAMLGLFGGFAVFANL